MARGFSSARHAPRGTHAEATDKAHRPRQCEQGGGLWRQVWEPHANPDSAVERVTDIWEPRVNSYKVGGAGVPPPCPTTECTQDGQGGLGPQESPGRTEQDKRPGTVRPTPAAKGGVGRPHPCRTTNCTQDGQGGLCPQESPGRTGQHGHQGPMQPGPAVSLAEDTMKRRYPKPPAGTEGEGPERETPWKNIGKS